MPPTSPDFPPPPLTWFMDVPKRFVICVANRLKSFKRQKRKYWAPMNNERTDGQRIRAIIFWIAKRKDEHKIVVQRVDLAAVDLGFLAAISNLCFSSAVQPEGSYTNDVLIVFLRSTLKFLLFLIEEIVHEWRHVVRKRVGSNKFVSLSTLFACRKETGEGWKVSKISWRHF